jgi:drug/metabolite transporter (DMT)-like permease
MTDADRRSVIAMSAGMASFVTNDSLVKYVSESLPSSQLIFVRGVFATLLLLCVCHALGATRQLMSLFDRRVMLRAGFDSFATVTYLTSLFHLPIANATAINMATPLMITLLAVLLFKEKVRASRWLAIAVGFTGVLLIVQPTPASFNAYAVLCLAGTLLHAGRDLATRGIHGGIPSIVVTLSTAVAVTALSGLWGLFQDWVPMNGQQAGLLAAASVFLSAGYYLLIIAMRHGEITLVAPFRYTGLLFALLIGFAVWGDAPNAVAFAGIALLVAAGIYLLRARS